MSTQRAGENAIILNTWMNSEESHSFSLPFIPPSIAETLNECQMQGMCLNPYLRSRFELCNSGNTLVTDVKTGAVSYFVQNSIGITNSIFFYIYIIFFPLLMPSTSLNIFFCYIQVIFFINV